MVGDEYREGQGAERRRPKFEHVGVRPRDDPSKTAVDQKMVPRRTAVLMILRSPREPDSPASSRHGHSSRFSAADGPW